MNNSIFDLFSSIHNYIGYNIPYILLIINSFLLLKQKKYLLIFWVFWGLDYILIGILKDWIRQPRPSGFLDKENHDGDDYSKMRNSSMYYGMPSGHAGLSFYSTLFIWLVNKSTSILITELTLCFLTCYHRFIYKKHTLEQLFAGAILGSFVALIAVGNLRSREPTVPLQGSLRFPPNPHPFQ